MQRPANMSKLLPLLGSALAAAVVFTAVMGFAHTKPGRPLLRLLRPLMGLTGARCPLGYDVAATPEQRDQDQLRFSAAHRGELAARSRPALGFTLDHTTRADVQAWAHAHAVACAQPKVGPDLDCANVDAQLLPEAFAGLDVRDLWLSFGAQGTLTSVVAVRRDAAPTAVSHTFAKVTSALGQQVGPAATQSGDASPDRLSAGALHQASAEYRFRDYYALARATNMGDGFVLTEEYRSLAR